MTRTTTSPGGDSWYRQSAGVCPHCHGAIEQIDLTMEWPGWKRAAVERIARAGLKVPECDVTEHPEYKARMARAAEVEDIQKAMWELEQRLRRLR